MRLFKTLLDKAGIDKNIFYLMNEISSGNSIEEESAENKVNASVCIPIKSRDGVFSNLNAKPEIMKAEHVGQYMDKPPSYSQAALNMPPTYQDAIDDFSVIEGMLVGNTSAQLTIYLIVFRRLRGRKWWYFFNSLFRINPFPRSRYFFRIVAIKILCRSIRDIIGSWNSAHFVQLNS